MGEEGGEGVAALLMVAAAAEAAVGRGFGLEVRGMPSALRRQATRRL